MSYRLAQPNSAAGRRPGIRRIPGQWWLAAAVVAVVFLLPYTMKATSADVVVLAMVYAMTVMGLNLVFGIAGQVTLGPAAVFAVGAYTAGLLSVHSGVGPVLSTIAAIAIAAIAGTLIGIPALRVGGFYLAMITALIANAIPDFANLYPSWDGAQNGLSPIKPLGIWHTQFSGNRAYWAVATIMFLVALLVANVAHSSWGRWFRALSVSEAGTNALGVSVYRAKLVAFSLSAAFGGLAGAIYAHYEGIIDSTQFGFGLSLILFASLVIGGLGSLWGALIGPFFYVLGPYFAFPNSGGEWVQIFFGAFIIVFMIAMRGGLVELLNRFGALIITYVVDPLRGRVRHPGPSGSAAPGAGALPAGTSKPATSTATQPDTDAFLRGFLARASRAEKGTPVLVATDVVKRFGGVRALDGVSIQINAGEITALIGPNGSGKTTLLNICSGHMKPDAGTIILDGQDVTRLPAYRRTKMGLARTFQRTVVFFGLTWTQSVMAGWARRRPTPLEAMFRLPRSRAYEREASERADALLRNLGLSRLIDTSPNAGTLAEARLVELARTLALDPIVLLLDEPAAGLDLEELVVLERTIAAVARAGVAVLLVEHDLAFVTRLADRSVVLDTGRIIFEGDPMAAQHDEAVSEAYFGSALNV
jgi:branched-chain amino acid transport system permease protein